MPSCEATSTSFAFGKFIDTFSYTRYGRTYAAGGPALSAYWSYWHSADFGAAYADSDLVISKGASNFETFRRSKTKDVVHLLRVKCPPVAHELGVRKGSLVLHRQRPTEPKA